MTLLQLFVFIPVMYIAVCAYTSLFRLRVFNYYHLVPYKMSNSVSLLFSAAYVCPVRPRIEFVLLAIRAVLFARRCGSFLRTAYQHFQLPVSFDYATSL